jgi:transposase InsO family protein
MLEGFPSIVQSDNGKEFKNHLLQDYLKESNVISKFGRPRHPQSQGQVERANQTLVRRMSKCLYGKSVRWIDILGKLRFFCLFNFRFRQLPIQYRYPSSHK